MRIRVVLTAAIVALALAGCSTATASPAATPKVTRTATTIPRPAESIGKTWTFRYEGAKGSFRLTGNSADPTVAAVETVRAQVDGTDATFVPVTIDNTAGTSAINMYAITVVTHDGTQIQSENVGSVISGWGDAVEDDTDLYNATVNAYNQDAVTDLQPGAKSTLLVAFAQPSTSASLVYPRPAGASDQVSADAD
jgi:hypothetical protein